LKSSAGRAAKKSNEIARHYGAHGPFLFLHVNLLDNRSEFSSPLEVSLRKEGDDYVGRFLAPLPSPTPSRMSARLSIRYRFSSASRGAT
jgi:hypothetical protein